MKRIFSITSLLAALVYVSMASGQGPGEKPDMPTIPVGEGEDSVQDPICQMTFPPDKAAFKEIFQGQTFYFCNQHCRNTFMETPSAYASSVQEVRGKVYRVTCYIASAKLYSGEETEIYVSIQPNSKTPPAWKPIGVEGPEVVLIADVGGGKTQESRPKLTFTKRKESGWFGAKARMISQGKLRLKLRINFDDKNSDDVEFVFPVLGGEETETGNEFDNVRLDMITQHETMHRTGKHWARAGMALEKGDVEAAKSEFARVKGYQKVIERMVPHYYEEPENMVEFKQIGAEYGKALEAMEAVLAKNDVDSAKAEWNKVDALHCTECHMKFRWATFSSRDVYPIREGK